MKLFGVKLKEWLSLRPSHQWWVWTILLSLIEFLFPVPGRSGLKQLCLFLFLWLLFWAVILFAAIIIVVNQRKNK